MTDTKYCSNCGKPVAGLKYCGACGQETDTDLPGLREFLGSFLEDLASFDSKLFRTARPLLTRPGFLTAEYLAGRRAAYARPFRLYLVCSLVFFSMWALLSAISGEALMGSVIRTNPGADSTAADTTAADIPAAAGAGLSAVDTAAADTAAVDTAATDTAAARGDSASDVDRLRPESIPLVGNRLRERLEQVDQHGVESVQDRVQSSMKRNLPKLAFVMVPVFGFLAWVLYRRVHRRYLAHLIFALHVHAYIFLLFILVISFELLPEVVGAPLTALVWLVYLIYLFRALRTVYGQGRGRTLWKLAVLTFLYNSLLGVGLAVTSFISFLQ